MNGLQSPHRIFNKYIEWHTTCIPGDSGLSFLSDEPSPRYELAINNFDWERLQKSRPVH